MSHPEFMNPMEGVDIAQYVKSSTDAPPPTTEPTPETPPATPPTEAPPEPVYDLGELGTFSREDLTTLLTDYQGLREQSQTWGDYESKTQELQRREQEAKEDIAFARMYKQDKEVAEALEPILRKRMESQPRDPATGQYVPKPDPRLTDEFMQNAQEAIQYVATLRQRETEAKAETQRLREVDKAWTGFKSANAAVVDESFEKLVAETADAITEKQGRLTTAADILMVANGILRGRAQVLGELKKQPTGTSVVTGAGGNETPPAPEKPIDLNNLGQALLDMGAIR